MVTNGAVSDDYEMIVLLLDFYGALLPDRQQEVLDYHYNEDLSFTEIAENVGVSRQAVHDAVKSGKQSLYRFEEKLSLQKRFQSQRNQVQEALDHLNSLKNIDEVDDRIKDDIQTRSFEKMEACLKKLLTQL